MPWRTENLNPSDSQFAEVAAKYYVGFNSVKKNQKKALAKPILRRDAYQTWISEIMLQHTQVVTVINYFQRWMEKFPDLRSLANADETEVLSAWAGLGYYSRARNLHLTAKKVMSDFDGVFPSDKPALLALKGIGEYTAGAIASLAFNLPEPILDGNLTRVFSRFYGLAFLPDNKANQSIYWNYSRIWVQSNVPTLVNEGLMELGALVCITGTPKCLQCPLNGWCIAYKTSSQNNFPVRKSKPKKVEVKGIVVVGFPKKQPHKILLTLSDRQRFLNGLFSFPIFETENVGSLKKKWAMVFPNLMPVFFCNLNVTVTHTITNHRIELAIFSAEIELQKGNENLKWVDATKMDDVLVSALSQKIWKNFLMING